MYREDYHPTYPPGRYVQEGYLPTHQGSMGGRHYAHRCSHTHREAGPMRIVAPSLPHTGRQASLRRGSFSHHGRLASLRRDSFSPPKGTDLFAQRLLLSS